MLDTSSERWVEIEVVGVVTSGGEDLVHSVEDGGHPLGGRRRRGPEGELVTTLLEGAVGHKQMEVDVEAQVTAEALCADRQPPAHRPGARHQDLDLDSAPATSDTSDTDNGKSGKRVTATHAVLWTGVVLASLGGAGLLGFGATGLATDRKLSKPE